jgi:hypothetical protein
MRKISLLLLFVTVLAACTGAPTPVVELPTLAVLPSATPSSTASRTPRATDTPTPTETPTPSFRPIPTETPTTTPTFTFTPSQTITDTVTFTPSPTFTASPELDSLGQLALLSQRATILPPEQLYNGATLTAVGYAALTHIAEMNISPTAPAPDVPILATLPPAACAVPPPGGLASDPSVTASLGCPQGSELSLTTAVEAFEHGSMLYLQGSPGSIYALTLDGRFRRFDDTWVSGVDPESGGETPPLGLLEPKRGFGKVWRNNLDVRGALGWAVTEEQGAGGSLQLFDHGRAIFLSQRGESLLLIDDPGGLTGSWRSLSVSF